MDIDAVTPVAEESAAVGMSEQSDNVNAADLFTSEEIDASAQQPAQESAPEQKAERTFTNADVEEIVRKRLAKQKNAYELGREILEEFMRQGNMSEADALKAIREQRIKSKAAMFKDNPEAFFEEQLRAREYRAEPDEAPTSDGSAEQMFRELAAEINSGRVPQEFDIRTYMQDPDRAREFLELRSALGVEKACEIAMRMQTTAKQTRRQTNEALPKSHGTNNSYSPKKLDYMEMSAEDFRKVAERVKKASAAGKRVEL